MWLILTFISHLAWFSFWSSRWAPAALSSGLHLLLQSDGGDAGPPERERLPQSCGREQPVSFDNFHPETSQVWWWDSKASVVVNHLEWGILSYLIPDNQIILFEAAVDTVERKNCTWLLLVSCSPSIEWAAMIDSWLKTHSGSLPAQFLSDGQISEPQNWLWKLKAQGCIHIAEILAWFLFMFNQHWSADEIEEVLQQLQDCTF